MKLKKLVFSIITVIALAIALVGCQTGGSKTDKIQIGILQFVEADALTNARLGFIEALAEAGFVDGENIIINYENANADFTLMATQAKSLVRKNDLVLGIATPAAIALVNEADANNINIPILFTAVTDPVSAELIASPQNPGGNVTGTNDMNPVELQIDLALDLLPNATKIGIIYTSSETNSEIQANRASAHALTLDLLVETITITDGSEINQALRSLANKNVDIIYIPTDNILADNIVTVGSILTELQIPAIVGEDNLVPATPSLTFGINYFDLGKLTGTQAVDILKNNKKPSDIPAVGLTEFKFVINQAKLEAIGITIPSELLDRVDE